MRRISLLFAIALSLPASAQGSRATIRGTVADPQGAVIINAMCILRDRRSGLELSALTNDRGTFIFTVNPGEYRLTVARSGFATETRDIQVTAGENLAVEVVLSPAPISEQVVVVSGSRQEELRESSTATVWVIPQEAMRDTGYERVGDVLAELPGVLIRPTGRLASSGVAGEQIQGIDSRQVLVLLDGLPLVGARGIKSGIINLNRQSVGRLDRIEVVKGASSALYGSDAIGGVINLITREPRSPLEGNLVISGGSFGTLDVRGGMGFASGKLSGYAEAERHRANDHDLTPTTFDTTSPKFHRNDLLLKLKYELTPRLALSFLGNAYRNTERGRSIGEQGPQVSAAADSMQNYALAAEASLGPLTRLTLRGYFARYDERSEIDVIALPAAIDSVANLNERYARGEAALEQVIGRHQFLQGGIEWSQDQYRGFNRVLGDNAGQQVRMTDIWLQDRLALHDRLVLALGGRYHTHSRYGSHAVPRIGALFRLSESVRVRASFGRGFRAPDLGQLYFRFFNPTNLYQVIGNPNLQPETSRTFQLGTDYNRRGLRLAVNLFRNDVWNLIDTQLLGRPSTPEQLRAIMAQFGIDPSFSPALNRLLFLYRNLTNIRTSGLEADAEWRLPWGFGIAGAYTYLDARDKQTGLYLPQRHRHQGVVRISWGDERIGLRFDMRGTYFSRWWLSPTTRAEGYQIWDLYTAKRLRGGAEVFLAVDNLADSTDPKLKLVPPTFDRADPGRTVRVGFRLELRRSRE
ncbi:MAG TPA: TonB-dependent receptor [Blastocatellia bacterium]|nr:TonB-dependent receptor [Blastocatellia bacterium]